MLTRSCSCRTSSFTLLNTSRTLNHELGDVLEPELRHSHQGQVLSRSWTSIWGRLEEILCSASNPTSALPKLRDTNSPWPEDKPNRLYYYFSLLQMKRLQRSSRALLRLIWRAARCSFTSANTDGLPEEGWFTSSSEQSKCTSRTITDTALKSKARCARICPSQAHLHARSPLSVGSMDGVPGHNHNYRCKHTQLLRDLPAGVKGLQGFWVLGWPCANTTPQHAPLLGYWTNSLGPAYIFPF